MNKSYQQDKTLLYKDIVIFVDKSVDKVVFPNFWKYDKKGLFLHRFSSERRWDKIEAKEDTTRQFQKSSKKVLKKFGTRAKKVLSLQNFRASNGARKATRKFIDIITIDKK